MNVKQVSDAWERGDPYEQYVGRWSRQVAPLFLKWLNVPAGRRWLDVGCGTGALCAAILDTCAASSVSGVEPSEGFLESARMHLRDSIKERITMLPDGSVSMTAGAWAIRARVAQ